MGLIYLNSVNSFFSFRMFSYIASDLQPNEKLPVYHIHFCFANLKFYKTFSNTFMNCFFYIAVGFLLNRIIWKSL